MLPCTASTFFYLSNTILKKYVVEQLKCPHAQTLFYTVLQLIRFIRT